MWAINELECELFGEEPHTQDQKPKFPHVAVVFVIVYEVGGMREKRRVARHHARSRAVSEAELEASVVRRTCSKLD
jgi:hypothetical protein